MGTTGTNRKKLQKKSGKFKSESGKRAKVEEGIDLKKNLYYN